jgi:hypothetical protein
MRIISNATPKTRLVSGSKLRPSKWGIAAANGLVTLLSNEPDPDEEYKFGGTVATVARSQEDFGSLTQSRQWTPKAADPGQWVWTDDYCNIVGALIRKLTE